jgi:RNA 3'-terminal phosphate cyclase (ATP)
MYLRIDGNYGEGGGQVLRTALSLSSILNKPIQVYNIRKGRKIPGLQPQHLTCVRACRKISSAAVSGDELGSPQIEFAPEKLSGDSFEFDVSEKKGSAGSVSLIIQSLFLPLLFAPRSSSVTLLGGTHVPWSPPYHYLKGVFLPTIARMGCRLKLSLEDWGWYPRGGGKLNARIDPVKELTPLNLTNRGELKTIRGISAVSNLPLSIAERQRDQGLKTLNRAGIDARIDLLDAPSPGKGTILFLLAEFEHTLAGFSALGALRKRAEQVAEEACQEFLEFLRSPAAIDHRLADQLIPYLARASGESTFITSKISSHLLTNIWAVQQFLPVKFRVEGEKGKAGRVTVIP